MASAIRENPYVQMALVSLVCLVVAVPLWSFVFDPSFVSLDMFTDPGFWIAISIGVLFLVFGFWIGVRGNASESSS